MGSALRLGMREHGLTAEEKEKLQHWRQYFNLPEGPMPSRSAIVGVLMLATGEEIPLHSGRSGGPWGGTHRGGIPRGPGSGANRYTLGHIEGHAAAIMHARQISSALLLIEKRPCGACDPNLMQMLPPGSRLDVVDPHSTTIFWSSQVSRR